MNNYSEKIAILTGDPNGIGAEITIKALNLLNLPTKDIIIISNSKIINTYGKLNNNYEVIENRPAAIRHAMDIAQKHDIIVLAGKGHETYQEIHGVKHHLDEREVVAAHLEEMRK